MKRRTFIMSFAAGCALTALPVFTKLKRPVVDWDKPIQTTFGEPMQFVRHITKCPIELIEVEGHHAEWGQCVVFEGGNYYYDGSKSLYDIINVGDSIEYWADTNFDGYGKEI